MQTKLTLGYLGFLPFAALTILPWILGESYEKISFQLLVVYGGIIISFLSGILWGNRSNARLIAHCRTNVRHRHFIKYFRRWYKPIA